MEGGVYNALETAVLSGDKAAVLSLLSGESGTEVRAALRDPALLCQAARLGHEDTVTLLAAMCPNINTVTKQGTPLCVAVECGYVTVVDSLLVNGASLSLPDPAGKLSSPFYLAALHGWVDILQLLISHSPGVVYDKRSQALVMEAAARGGHEDTVRLWVDQIVTNLPPSQTIHQDLLQRAMEEAAKNEHVGVMSYLLTIGAELTSHLVDTYPHSVGELLMQGNIATTKHRKTSNKIRGLWRSKRLQMIHEDWLRRLTDTLAELDLSNNRISGLPDCLPWRMRALRSLFVRGNTILALNPPPDGQIDCQCLEEVDFSHNHLVTVTDSLFYLPKLETLSVSHNSLATLGGDPPSSPLGTTSRRNRQFYVSLPGEPWTCFGLKNLDISHNQITELPEGLKSCFHLSVLNISNNKIQDLTPAISCELIELDASHNSLSSLPVSLDQTWSKATKINLSHNKLTEIPQCICRLGLLVELNVSYNSIVQCPPDSWWESCVLKKLYLNSNQLQHTDQNDSRFRISTLWTSNKISTFSLPSKWSECLEELYLSGNCLRSVPPSVCNMLKLYILDLSHNPHIEQLPGELSQLIFCYSLMLAGLKLKNVPKQLITGANYTFPVMAYLKQQLRSAVAYNKVKLMVVGKESKGKTTLIDTLQGLPLPPNIATNGVVIKEWKVTAQEMKKKVQKPNINYQDVVFQMWDFAGQSDYYVTHKVFLSPSAIYLLVFDLKLHKEGVDGLRNWLLDIQAHAPNSNVIIVGTFLDHLTSEGRGCLPVLEERIHRQYREEAGYPRLLGVLPVSNHTGEGMDALRTLIYQGALQKKVRKVVMNTCSVGREPLIGRMVPKSYVDLAEVVQTEARRRLDTQQWPVLTEDEFLDLVQSDKKTDITSKEEFSLVVSFLCESGIILHFPNQLRGLNFLYFIDPSWLAQRLARFITLQASHTCVRDGVLDLADAQQLLFKEETHKSGMLAQYVELLERFEIALQLDPHRLLLPSKLPDQRPGLELFGSRGSGVRGREVFRVYRMPHEPSGFWSRLIAQILVMVKRLGDVSDTSSPARALSWAKLRQVYDDVTTLGRHARLTYWQKGIQVDLGPHQFCVESLSYYKPPPRPPSYVTPGSDVTTSGDDVMDDVIHNGAGLMIKVMSDTGDFSLLGFVVDQVDSLLDQWFPGVDSAGVNRCERLIPCPGCMSNVSRDDLSRVHTLRVKSCALAAIHQRPLCDLCPRCGHTEFQPELLIPDLLLLDLADLHINPQDLEFDREGGKLGQGGEGTVFLGMYQGTTQVAVKENGVMEYVRGAETSSNTNVTSDSGRESEGEVTVSSNSTEGRISTLDISSGRCSSGSGSLSFDSDNAQLHVDFKLLGALRSVRQEAVLMTQLTHPCIISMLGVDPLRMLHVLELAPLGSLRTVLEDRGATLPGGQDQGDGGCVLGRMLTFKIIYQITAGLKYLHSLRIVYKDLKADNVLVWSAALVDTVNIKLSDYGLARVFPPQGLRGYEGTVGYQAPEMRYGECYDEKVGKCLS